MRKHFLLLSVSYLVFATVASAAPSPTKGTSSANRGAISESPQSTMTDQLSAPGPTESLYGKLEMRPTLATGNGKIDAQNTLEAGYQFNPNLRVLYAQGFNFDLRNNGAAEGANLVFPDARFELDINRIWTSKEYGLAFDYQPRMHLPTDSLKRANGMLTYFRNQLNLTKTINPTLSFGVSVIPTFHIYKRAGGADATGAPAANPVFENGLEVGPTISFTPRLRLGIPLKLYIVRYAAFQTGAAFNDRWGYTFTTKPELIYNFDRNVMLGVAFETGNLITDDFSKTTFSDGFRNGVAQFVAIVTL